MPLNPPGQDAGDYEWLILEQAGVLTTRQAVGLLGRRKVDGHLDQGRWRRLCRGVLLTHNGRLDPDQQLWAAVLTMGDGAHLAGATAMAIGGVTGFKPESIHVLIPGQRSRSIRAADLPAGMAGVSVHRTTVLPAGHQQTGGPHGPRCHGPSSTPRHGPAPTTEPAC